MPGLSQLKQFNKDILSLGDEVNIRASRGERPVRIPIPRTIKDVNDSDDFIIEMPENPAPVASEENDNDFSDIISMTGGGGAAKTEGGKEGSSEGEGHAEMFAAPDFSSLLGSMEGGETGGGDEGMPDLSMFMDEPEETEPEPEPEPEEPKPVSIEDMGLEALLGGTGFDGSEIDDAMADTSSASVLSDEFYSDEELDAIPAPTLPSADKSPASANKTAASSIPLKPSDMEGLDTSIFDIGGSSDSSAPATNAGSTSDDLDLAALGIDVPGLTDTAVSSDAGDVQTPGDVPADFLADLTAGTGDAAVGDDAGVCTDEFSLGTDSSAGTDATSLATDDFSPDTALSADAPAADSLDELGSLESLDNFDEPSAFGAGDEGNDILGTSSGSKHSDEGFKLPDDFGDMMIDLDDTSEDAVAFSAAKTAQSEKTSQSEAPSQLENTAAERTVSSSSIDPEIQNAMGSFDFGTFDLDTLPDVGANAKFEPKPEFELFDFEPVVKEGAIIDEEPEEENAESAEKPAPADKKAASVEQPSDAQNAPSESSENVSDDFLEDIFSNIEDMNTEGADEASSGETETSADNLENAGDLESLSLDDIQLPETDSAAGSDESLSEIGDIGLDIPAADSLGADNFDIDSPATESFDIDSLSMDGLDTAGLENDSGSTSDINTSDINIDDFNADEISTDGLDANSLTDNDNIDAFDGDGLTDSAGGFDAGGTNDGNGADAGSGMSFDDMDFSLDDMDMPSESTDENPVDNDNPFDSETPAGVDGTPGDDVNALNSGFAGLFDDINTSDSSFDVTEDIPDDSNNSFDASPFEDDFSDVDTSAMDGMDFSSEGGDDNSFDLGNEDEFSMEGDDFEIPGYSDVETAKMDKSPSSLAGSSLPTPDFSGGLEGEKLPPNTLSDEQYKEFLSNLNEYPLNVRLAFEDLIVRDELTDDAEFDLIEKVLEKVPARQLASSLEKILDITLPVPRDFEHRTAEEYEAYKKSLQYQLRNKIIPAALIGIVVMLVSIGVFQFVKNCIYVPLKAKSLYKQGYELIMQNEYPQSEMKFNEALKYKKNKKWFFNYARGYREHRQYQRSESMYDLILRVFNHDKTAGLEYANMELHDLANYERAEEIVRRDILDYHVNDEEGILTLGDVFLEWASEKDPSKFESAREQYETLISLYGPKDTYLSRMMRYNVRTDNLPNVFMLKQTFDANKKLKMNSDDLTEVGGYLLDKLYGPVSPAEENLRNQIEGVRGLLVDAVKADGDNPTAWYNLSRYYINTNENQNIERTLQRTIEKYNSAKTLKARDIYRYIDSYRLLGEFFVENDDYIKAQEQYTEGLSLYTTERDSAGFVGNKQIGKLYEDLGDINYFISGEYKQALLNYQHSVELDNDSPEIRYRIGYIQYKTKKYAEALGSFMKAGTGNARHNNLMLAMANTLSLRGDDYAASGYYGNLIAALDDELVKRGITFPQTSAADYELINTYLHAANNYGVTLHRLAARTGDSSQNAEAVVQFQQSVRAWDALTRNQNSMERLDGSNLALENIRYITHPFSDYEPAIYTDIEKTLTNKEGIK